MMENIVKKHSDSLYTVEEVSIILKLSTQTVRKMMKTGDIKFIKIGRNIRIRDSELNRLIENIQEF